MLSCVSGTRDTEMKRKCACPQLGQSLGREWDILMNKCNVISSIIPGTDKAWKRNKEFYMELRKTFRKKMVLKEKKWEVVSDRRHCIWQGVKAWNCFCKAMNNLVIWFHMEHMWDRNRQRELWDMGLVLYNTQFLMNFL